ncbi:SDR family NAD(P)-dependent oxidoreductase [Halobacillus litoralis]|uniref:SDR family NAD(P)-dependent oxidoreductase n=1 Tax=Halobacillus litoralis TaxID=45668 RepID=A0A845DR30_9BACI|nr:oxidoreductase [Halobacillus litoralis]MYL19638.1 SDR family NAD(P)-dependent oxidoreductase [Halobacillus litoralis]MYL37034.1 SDR family NAD(P)-dependent oxidoreductase [Halobacillus litoralis]
MNVTEWSVPSIPSMEGKIVVVTGGNGGLGLEAVKVLGEKGATVIMASRSKKRGEQAADLLKRQQSDIRVDVMELDLADLDSVASFAEQFKEKYDRLDILMNNAGVMTTPYGKTKDGFELQFGTNHLGHFALTARLFERLAATEGSRVVTISSNAHKSGSVNFDNLMFEQGKGYTPMKSYSRSKFANLLFAFELQRRIDQAGLSIKSLGAHPGGAQTDLARHIEDRFLYKALSGVLKRVTQSAYEGALPGIRAATDPDLEGGRYVGPSGFMEMKGDPVLVKPKTETLDVLDAEELWAESERLTGVSFTVTS